MFINESLNNICIFPLIRYFALANDGSRTNYDAFWARFSELLGKDVLKLLPEFEDFYGSEFNKTKALVPSGYTILPLLDELKSMDYTLVLATNPIFPEIASKSRLSWLGASMDDFAYITTMENSRYSKPNLKYYEDLFEKIGKKPEECLMVGNNVHEDMCVASLGSGVFLITEHLENENNIDISSFPQGSFEDFLAYVKRMEWKSKGT